MGVEERLAKIDEICGNIHSIVFEDRQQPSHPHPVTEKYLRRDYQIRLESMKTDIAIKGGK